MSHPFISDPAWVHGQGQEEHERWSEECRSVLGPQTFLIVSPVVTPGEDATLFSVEAAGDLLDRTSALVDRDMAQIRRMFQLLVEDIMEEVEVLADEKQQQGSSQDLDEKILEEQGQQRPGGLNELLALDALWALATLQVELSSDHEKNCRA
ncbi:testis-specific Y-encoded protein 1-like [Bos taurus]|uniref:testis-specific Y-encoded protein 1-like n=1 Tax=Bos taurus TaxID=9913 RepID=UPI0028CB1FF1|nr:testis-specific Y-encoded protein 1-like [Bos taurus]